MHAAFVLQLRVRAVAVHLELDLVVAAHPGWRGIDDLDLPALLLSPARVHAEQVRGEKRGLVSALGSLDLDHDVAVVVRVLGQKKDLELLVELDQLPGRPMFLRAHVLLHLGVLLVAQHLARRVHLVARFAVCVISHDDLPEGALLTRELGELLVVGSDLRPRHVLLDLAIAARDRLEAIDHFLCPARIYAAAPALSSSPSRALLKAQIATSSISSAGSRVVNFCVPSTGSSVILTMGW